MSEPCELTLIVNGELIDPNDAQEVMDDLHDLGRCPEGPVAADFQIDQPTSARQLAAQMIVLMHRTTGAMLL